MALMKPETKKALIALGRTLHIPIPTPGKKYRESISLHSVGRWVRPEKNPKYGLYKVLPTGCIRVKPAREYTKEEAMWRFATYLKRPEYFLDIVEMSKIRTKPEPWEDTRLA